MSGDHNMNQKPTIRIDGVDVMKMVEAEWRDKCQRYIDIHDAVVRDNERLIELLHRCETEMRYAGWTTVDSDNYMRNEVYKEVVRNMK